MSTIQSIPNEILLKIFEKLQIPDLLQCEKFCKAWRLPSHTTLLCNVELCGDVAVQQFIVSIDQNSDASYLNAVKSIKVDSVQNLYGTFDNVEALKKLLCRFPNLETVKITDSFPMLDAFNDDLCEHFLKSCTKLCTFDIDYRYVRRVRQKNRDNYSIAVKKVRKLLTVIDFGIINSPTAMNIRGIMQLLGIFPHLKSIRRLAGDFNNIEKALPVFELLPKSTGLSIIDATGDMQDFF